MADEMTQDDLSEEQRAWFPTSFEDAYGQWPNGYKIEAWDGALQYTDGEPYEGGWDWRSVALAARTYPGATITLHSPGHLSVKFNDTVV